VSGVKVSDKNISLASSKRYRGFDFIILISTSDKAACTDANRLSVYVWTRAEAVALINKKDRTYQDYSLARSFPAMGKGCDHI
jgi:hypothetical protein